MPFTKAQDEAGKAAISKYLKSCPVCQTNNFLLSGELTFLTQIDTTKTVQLGAGQPCLSASCTNCSHVILFNILYLGLGEVFGMKSQAEEAQAQKKVGNG